MARLPIGLLGWSELSQVAILVPDFVEALVVVFVPHSSFNNKLSMYMLSFIQRLIKDHKLFNSWSFKR